MKRQKDDALCFVLAIGIFGKASRIIKRGDTYLLNASSLEMSSET